MSLKEALKLAEEAKLIQTESEMAFTKKKKHYLQHRLPEGIKIIRGIDPITKENISFWQGVWPKKIRK